MALNSFQTLRSFIIRTPERIEQCDFCSAALEDQHQHLVEPLSRRLVCACNGCAMLFASEGTTYRRIPRRARSLGDFQMTDAQWDSLMIPINMAFFFKSSAANKVVALYPSPAGPIESLVPLETWDEIARANPSLKTMEPDVEALLVNRTGQEYYLLPIDKCFELVGLMRMHWHGLPGGSDVWERIGQFFGGLQRRHA